MLILKNKNQMKKVLFVVAVATFFLTACTHTSSSENVKSDSTNVADSSCVENVDTIKIK